MSGWYYADRNREQHGPVTADELVTHYRFGRIALGFLLSFAVGFLLVTIFYRGGSLLSCIFDHAAINMLGFMLLSGWRLGFCRYMICFVAVNLFILLMMSWNWIR